MSENDKPKPTVACICITADRPEFTDLAVQAFRQQDYEARALLIFDTSKELPMRKYEDYGIFHWYEARRPDDTVGSLRNRANSFAETLWQPEFLAHWDSDDISAPGRLTDQVKRIIGSAKAMTGYRTILFTDGTRRWIYRGDPQFAAGTSLLYRTQYWRDHKFANLQIAEDNEAVRAAWADRQLSTAEGHHMITAWVHPGNTSKKAPAGNWEEIKS